MTTRPLAHGTHRPGLEQVGGLSTSTWDSLVRLYPEADRVAYAHARTHVLATDDAVPDVSPRACRDLVAETLLANDDRFLDDASRHRIPGPQTSFRLGDPGRNPHGSGS